MTDKVTVELIRSSLYYASEEMGIALRNSSYSSNIKERMDHSAALFDAHGRLLAQAEHIPVHLGSLPFGLRKTIEYCKRNSVELEEGSMVVLNDPYISGTQLNDVTVIRPIYQKELVAFAANKAHHTDIGGKVPGSISIDAKSIYEEGLIIDPIHLMKENEFSNETLSLFRTNSRTPIERIGDLKAQVAANVTGERRVLQVLEKYGLESFNCSAKESLAYSERMLRSRISSRMKKGRFKAEDYIEVNDKRDITLRVEITIGEESIKVDYAGTDEQVQLPINAVLGVTLSGVHFVVRTLTGDDVPMNEGALGAVEIEVPEGTVLNATRPFPVAGGNVEMSQRNVDVLYKAFDESLPGMVPAASGGSMNNVMLGGTHDGKPWVFYETIGVGLGGRNGMDGLDGIHSNMTNTMNTPIEEIEKNLPIIMRRYELREDSCGAGEFRGGSGIRRAFQFMDKATTVTVLADRGVHAPWGLKGGKAGAKTKVVLRNGSSYRSLPIKYTLDCVEKGVVIEIATAGGGGYGVPMRRRSDAVENDIHNHIISTAYAGKCGWAKDK